MYPFPKTLIPLAMPQVLTTPVLELKPLSLHKLYNITLLISKDVFPGEKTWIK